MQTEQKNVNRGSRDRSAGPRRPLMLTVKSVLKTLRRADDRVILAVMGRELVMEQCDECLCGWFLREKLAEIRNVGASTITDVYFDDTVPGCAEHFGGTPGEWQAIFDGVSHDGEWESWHGDELAIIETAFAIRVNQAVFGRRSRHSRKVFGNRSAR